MSVDQTNNVPSELVAVHSEPAETVAPVPAAPPPQRKLLEADKLSLDLAKEKRKTALAEAKAALATNENAELSFKYIVLQLYMKYGLSEKDAIAEDGVILIGGAVGSGQETK